MKIKSYNNKHLSPVDLYYNILNAHSLACLFGWGKIVVLCSVSVWMEEDCGPLLQQPNDDDDESRT